MLSSEDAKVQIAAIDEKLDIYCIELAMASDRNVIIETIAKKIKLIAKREIIETFIISNPSEEKQEAMKLQYDFFVGEVNEIKDYLIKCDSSRLKINHLTFKVLEHYKEIVRNMKKVVVYKNSYELQLIA